MSDRTKPGPARTVSFADQVFWCARSRVIRRHLSSYSVPEHLDSPSMLSTIGVVNAARSVKHMRARAPEDY